jgi:hypothetical protein
LTTRDVTPRIAIAVDLAMLIRPSGDCPLMRDEPRSLRGATLARPNHRAS